MEEKLENDCMFLAIELLTCSSGMEKEILNSYPNLSIDLNSLLEIKEKDTIGAEEIAFLLAPILAEPITQEVHKSLTQQYKKALELYPFNDFPREHLESRFELGFRYLMIGELEEAYSVLEIAIDQFEKKQYEISKLLGNKLGNEGSHLYLRMVQTCLKLGSTQPIYCGKALEYVERSKARSTLRLLNLRNVRDTLDYEAENLNLMKLRLKSLDKKLTNLKQDILNEIGDLELEVLLELEDSNSNSLMDKEEIDDNELMGEDNLREFKEGISQIEDGLKKNQKIISDLNKSIEFHEIHRLITDESTVIIEWYFTSQKFIVFIVCSHFEYPVVWQSPNNEESLDQLSSWCLNHLKLYYDFKNQWNNSIELEKSLQDLSKLLFLDEILSNIPKECKKLIIVPHCFLHQFPIHALPISDGSLFTRFPEGVKYSPSCKLLQLAQQKSERKKQPQLSSSFCLAIQNPTQDLIASDLEVKSFSKNFQYLKILSGNNATKDSLVKHLNSKRASQFNVVHFACHGVFSFEISGNSCLKLADQNLYLSEVLDLNFKEFNLVVLSGCETGLVDFNGLTDTYTGLSSAFLCAGTSSLVSSLWEVNDLATALMMNKFYQHLFELSSVNKGSVAIALNKAQQWLKELTTDEFHCFLNTSTIRSLLETISNELPIGKRRILQASIQASMKRHPHPFADPYYWAAFVAIGY
ncbi:MAG: CHAT domain-containing protein [Symploca sp. SIO2B6]|nr:CHAT domain-containing protein [Symploca sp. SIO2B6]